jgi:hypothetical protein
MKKTFIYILDFLEPRYDFFSLRGTYFCAHDSKIIRLRDLCRCRDRLLRRCHVAAGSVEALRLPPAPPIRIAELSMIVFLIQAEMANTMSLERMSLMLTSSRQGRVKSRAARVLRTMMLAAVVLDQRSTQRRARVLRDSVQRSWTTYVARLWSWIGTTSRVWWLVWCSPISLVTHLHAHRHRFRLER